MQKLIDFTFSYKLESPNIKHHWGTILARNKKLKKKILTHWLTIPLHLKSFVVTTNLNANYTQSPMYTVKISRLSPRKMDSDNFIFACKYIRDIIADLLVSGLGYGQADNEKYINFQYEQEKSKEHLIKIEILKNE